MNLFKKLFQSERGSVELSNIPKNETIKPKQTIFDFFQIDLRNIPDESFVAGEVEENESGESIEFFRKNLAYKECGIFDTIEMVVIGGKGKNVFLKSFDPKRVDINKLKTLINDLYLIHGNDSEDKGKFTDQDKIDYYDKEFYMLFGRSWTDYPKYKHPVSVGRQEAEVSISIWGVEQEEAT